MSINKRGCRGRRVLASQITEKIISSSHFTRNGITNYKRENKLCFTFHVSFLSPEVLSPLHYPQMWIGVWGVQLEVIEPYPLFREELFQKTDIHQTDYVIPLTKLKSDTNKSAAVNNSIVIIRQIYEVRNI